jgi:cation transport ATPase
MALNLYIVDTVMVICAAGSVASSAGEARRQPFRRRRLLYPGTFAVLSAILMLAFPQLSDLLDVQFWFVMLVSILLGVVRGAFIAMASDHYWKLVRLESGIDSLLAAIAVLAVAALQFAIEATTGAENGAETTFEFVISVISGYLFGRSIAAYFRARALHHHDLQEV